jgi:hypothetical protein
LRAGAAADVGFGRDELGGAAGIVLDSPAAVDGALLA